MIRIAYTMCAALFVIVCVSLIPVLSQDMGDEKKPADPMEEWAKLAQPGPQHKWLAEEVGDWNIEGKMWLEPGKDPVPFKATSKITMFQDRYLHEEYVGEGEQGMKGFGVLGYDNSNKEFQMIWTSNMETSLHVMSGQLDEKTQTLTLAAEWTEAGMGGMKVKTRVVSQRKSKDEALLTVYSAYGDAPENKAIEMKYTRKK